MMSNLYSSEGFRAPFKNPVHLWLGNLLHCETDTFVAETGRLVNYSMLSTSSVSEFLPDHIIKRLFQSIQNNWFRILLNSTRHPSAGEASRQASISKSNRVSIATEKQTDPVLIDYESRWPLASSGVYKILYITGNEAWVVESRRLQDLPPKSGFLFSNTASFLESERGFKHIVTIYKTLKSNTFPNKD